MTDIVITPSLVIAGTNATRDIGTAGEAIVAGKPVYFDSTVNKWKLSDNNGTGTRQVHGIALNGASLNQPVSVAKGGDVTIGATLTAGVAYYLSATAGGICPVADLTTGMDTILIGLAKSTTVLGIGISDSGVTL
ncbi:hypothetical protein [Rhizobium rhizogenes]|uniref:hypothetical protein n=1 Tax=Rhizobium rhizogenes TaxID=359 RepID=UPI0004D477FF|nr:hypothetical protein [Rhizobium rhizogenes]KEA07484.1 hypothetical protein CN09_11300 [Rhizobium rhizogenes]NTJ22242.1 hypothetical protein [Rhizobium rhizogenes]QUE80960.1 hypothetical protein EML492_03880 [Rhizobium rhizogenes]TQO80934.1 hypothetical protein FFE80_07520 [Rhizobium rhizogenes]TRB51528.1 hypothetical protein EXN69_26405 [Rhizobium rhizogenes]